jgi:cysteine desulfurase
VATEHSAVLDVVAALARSGFTSTLLPVDRYGRVDPSDVLRAAGEKTLLVSVMLANNEIGTLQPVREIAALCRARGILVHTDATQAVGHMAVDVQAVDLLSCSAHKMYGPKGVGALFVRGGLAGGLLKVQMHGGGQESGLRSGTLNVPGIMGFGAAARIAIEEMAEEAPRVRTLRDALARAILGGVPESVMNGDPAGRLDRNLSVTFHGARADAVMMSMKRVAVSSGSACSAVAGRTSHVLRAIGLDEQDAACTLRFGLGRFTTAEEISFAGECVAAAVAAVRAGTA